MKWNKSKMAIDKTIRLTLQLPAADIQTNS